jgi:arsenate reductase
MTSEIAEPTETTPRPLRVLFLCTHNSSRSQMAEGFLRARGGEAYETLSAGTHPRSIHPLAIRAMADVGIDISPAAGHRAKGMDEFAGQTIDLVVTVCDDAAEECPFFPGARRQEHWGFPDPSAATGTEEERLQVFRRVRDAIALRIEQYLQEERTAAATGR